jgi:hypothetical protein
MEVKYFFYGKTKLVIDTLCLDSMANVRFGLLNEGDN